MDLSILDILVMLIAPFLIYYTSGYIWNFKVVQRKMEHLNTGEALAYFAVTISVAIFALYQAIDNVLGKDQQMIQEVCRRRRGFVQCWTAYNLSWTTNLFIMGSLFSLLALHFLVSMIKKKGP